MRLIDFFDRGAALWPHRDFLVDDASRFTYREAQALSRRIAGAMDADGFSPGGKAAVLSGNDALAFVCVLGLIRAGGVWVPLNFRNATPENAGILNDTDVEWLFYHGALEAQADELRRSCPGIRRSVCLDRTGAGGPSFGEWIAAAADARAKEPPDDPETVVAILSTGGTTGRPKGVMLPNRSWVAQIANYHAHLPTRTPPVHLVAAPLTHAAGGHVLWLMPVGGTNIILRRAEPQEIMERIQAHRVTHLFLPPTVIYMMLGHPRVRDFDYSSLEHFMYGAAPMSVDRLRQAIEVFGPVMIQAYGQTEAPAPLCVLAQGEHAGPRLASCGRPTLMTRLEIMDDAGRLLPAGERGEIVIRSDAVMTGYYKKPELTAEVSAHGWHHTGDIAYKDAEGYVYLVDRKNDMVITGGFNVYPREVEEVLWSHPAVQDCAVVGVPDETWGEALKAVVELKRGLHVEPAALIALCRERLGGVKTPKSVEFWETLPRSPAGKVKRREIRDGYWGSRDRNI